MIFKHANTSLIKAIHEAGSQTNLAKALGIPPSQLSAWLHNPDVNMPVKYGDAIEHWSKGKITKLNLFPTMRNIPTISENSHNTDNYTLEDFISRAREEGIGITVHIALDTQSFHIPAKNVH